MADSVRPNQTPAAAAAPTVTRSPRGGRRPGAGRPPAYTEPLVRKTITLPRSYIPHLEREGAGNLSEGVRFLMEQARTPGGDYWFRLNPADPADSLPPRPPAANAPLELTDQQRGRRPR
jgi:hypothetical protein